MITQHLSRLARNRWLRLGILVAVAAAAAGVWLTRSNDRPALAIAHLSLEQIETQLYDELVAIHGKEICSVSGESMHEADGYSSALAAEHSNGLPSDKVLALFEENTHSFEQVDDFYVNGPFVTFVSYAEDRNSAIILNGGDKVHGTIAVMHAFSGGAAGERWEFAYRASYERCDP